MRQTASVLVVAGEASGDAMAAPVIRRLGVVSFGIGGPALLDAGTELCADASRLAAMGLGGVLARAPAIGQALLAVLREVAHRRPRAALLVGYTEFNAWLGIRLRARGVRVLWYGAPQIWAWRSRRSARIRKACDRMAVLLGFEEGIWRAAGVDAHFVGHPALEAVGLSRSQVRERFGLTPYADYVAVLPGSRVQEVRRHLDPMLDAVNLLRAERGALDARVIVTPSLPGKVARWMARRAAREGISTLETPAAAVLPGFDVALAKSGTVSLESAVAGVPPVIVYKASRTTELVARRLLRIRNVGLPNIVLGERIFPELLQEQASAEAMADHAERMLEERSDWRRKCSRVRHALTPDDTGAGPSERVARLIAPWLD